MKPLSEGKEKGAGTNKMPMVSKQKIKPPGQKPFKK